MPAPLIVRLPNHLGDACMCLPALDLLAECGHALTLVGRPWARSLFSAYPWPVTAAGEFWSTVGSLRALARAAAEAEGLLFTNSFSTALQFRLAGVRSTGYARDGRSVLLSRPIAVPAAWNGPMHMVEYYYALAAAFGDASGEPPARLSLALSAPARDTARVTLKTAGIGERYVVLCPAAVGRHRGQVKAWSGFRRLAEDLHARGITVVACPGPGETAAVRAAVTQTIVLPEVGVDVFAALLEGSRLVVANDSGAGHVAAAVNAALVSVFGVTEPHKTRPWGPKARLVGSENGWPAYEEVLATVMAALG